MDEREWEQFFALVRKPHELQAAFDEEGWRDLVYDQVQAHGAWGEWVEFVSVCQYPPEKRQRERGNGR
jgi:hypothetical protein